MKYMKMECYLIKKQNEIQVTSAHEKVFDVLTIKPRLVRREK